MHHPIELLLLNLGDLKVAEGHPFCVHICNSWGTCQVSALGLVPVMHKRACRGLAAWSIMISLGDEFLKSFSDTTLHHFTRSLFQSHHTDMHGLRC